MLQALLQGIELGFGIVVIALELGYLLQAVELLAALGVVFEAAVDDALLEFGVFLIGDARL